MVVSPAQMLQNLPNKLTQQHFLFPRAYPSSVDDSSEISLNDITLNDSFSDDNDAFLDSSASCSDIVSLQGIRKNKVDSLSNKSVSSLITNAENQEKDVTTEEKSEAEIFQVEESFKEINSGITTHSEKDGADTELVLPLDHKDCVNSAEITLDNSMPLDGNSENIADVGDHSEGESDKGDNFEGESGKGDLSEGESDKGGNFDADSGKGDHSESASGKLDKSVDTPNLIDDAAPEFQPKAGDQTDMPQVSEIKDNEEDGSSSDAARKDNSPETTSRPKHSKRFVRGILVNDYDEITKL